MRKAFLLAVLMFVIPFASADVRINTGGNSFTDSQGNLWQADAYYNVGSKYSTSVNIAGTNDDEIYRSERWDPSWGSELEYSIPVTNGEYLIKLHFAEIWSGAFQQGKRVFDVSVGGTLLLDDLDIYKESGPATALIKQHRINVSNGKIEILFEHVKQNPKISGIEIIEVQSYNYTEIRINSGGNSYTDSTGNEWLSDRYYNTGSKYTTSSSIAGTNDDDIYKSERWDASWGSELEYSIAVPNGNYTVKLHFAEIWSGAFQNGVRVFDVGIEGQSVLDNYDIFNDAGPRTAVVKSFQTEVRDGELNILFEHVKQNPKISGIEVLAPEDKNISIDVWYGPVQSFGSLGKPQTWINILGSVSDWIGSITMSFLFNQQEPLSLGPDSKRLASSGDFNVEILYSELTQGTNNVLISATDDIGTIQTLVSVEYSSGNTWPLPYSINWSNVTNIQDVAQVTDGKWALTGNGVRTVEIGYDRLIQIGDVTWTDYEITVPVTIHDVYFNDIYTMVGILTRWHGHTQDGNQPSTQYWPLGGIGSLRFTNQGNKNSARLHIFEYEDLAEISSASEARTVELGVRYIYKMRVETGSKTIYSLKVWKESDSEPVNWDLVTSGLVDSPSTGSLALLAHHVDAEFGDVSIVEALS